jgi:hypothetical protein
MVLASCPGQEDINEAATLVETLRPAFKLAIDKAEE